MLVHPHAYFPIKSSVWEAKLLYGPNFSCTTLKNPGLSYVLWYRASIIKDYPVGLSAIRDSGCFDPPTRLVVHRIQLVIRNVDFTPIIILTVTIEIVDQSLAINMNSISVSGRCCFNFCYSNQLVLELCSGIIWSSLKQWRWSQLFIMQLEFLLLHCSNITHNLKIEVWNFGITFCYIFWYHDTARHGSGKEVGFATTCCHSKYQLCHYEMICNLACLFIVALVTIHAIK